MKSGFVKANIDLVYSHEIKERQLKVSIPFYSVKNRHFPFYTLKFFVFQSHLNFPNRQENSSTKKHGQWSSKNKKGTRPVLKPATGRHTTESAGIRVPEHNGRPWF